MILCARVVTAPKLFAYSEAALSAASATMVTVNVALTLPLSVTS